MFTCIFCIYIYYIYIYYIHIYANNSSLTISTHNSSIFVHLLPVSFGSPCHPAHDLLPAGQSCQGRHRSGSSEVPSGSAVAGWLEKNQQHHMVYYMYIYIYMYVCIIYIYICIIYIYMYYIYIYVLYIYVLYIYICIIYI